MIAELPDRFVEFATNWLWLILLATWRALPILIVVTGIGLVLRRKLTPSLHALLLTVVLVRLLLPVSVGSPLSLHEPIDNWFSGDSGESASRTGPPMARDHVYDLPQPVDFIASPEVLYRVQAQPLMTSTYSWQDVVCVAILFIVVSVSIWLLFRAVLSHIRFAIRLRSCRLLDQQPLVDLMLRECDSLSVGRRPALREVSSLPAPAVFGIFRKTICLPPGLIATLSEQELRWVIRHELAHICRRDIPVVTMASIAGAFHWFNPIAWVVVSRLRAAMEAAADRLALQGCSQSEASAYGKLLLRFAEVNVEAKRSPTLGLISFASGKRLKQRVALLMRDEGSSQMVARILVAGLVPAVAFVGLTDARETEQKMPDVHLVADESIESHVQPLWLDPFNDRVGDGPAFVENYDLVSIFETMPNALTSSGKSQQEQLAVWLPLPASVKEKLHIEGQLLSVSLTARQHQLLKQILDAWRSGEPKQIVIEARFIQTDIKTASSIDWAGQRIEGLAVKGLGPAIAARIGEPELARLVRSVSAGSRGSILFAPKVTIFNGQTACIADQVRRPFVTGVDPKSDGVMQPVISMVDEGLSFVLMPRTDDDGGVTLAFEVKATGIGKVSYANLPIRTPNGAEPQFTVQVPATKQYEVSSSVKLAVGESIVVAVPRVFDLEPGADAETTTIVTLTPRVLATQEVSDASDANH